ncbi:MAG: RNA-binding protein [Pseudomonadota bacterium]
MARGGQAKKADTPERRCIATGDTGPKSGLVRFVLGPENQVVPDILGRLPGRGIWVSADRSAIDLAVTKNLFTRAAKSKVQVPADLGETVERLLARRVTELVAMARKAGQAVAGFEKVKDWLSQDGKVKVLLQASDGSSRGKSKLWTPTGARYFGCLTASELGLAFGRQSVIHGALGAGGLSPRVVEEAAKLQGLREADGGKPAGKDDKDA